MAEASMVIVLLAVVYGGLLLFYLALLAVTVVDYILTARATSAIARNRGIDKPWLAWIPYASSWTVGSIVDYHDEQLTGTSRNWKKALLGFAIAFAASYALFYTVYIVFYALFYGVGISAIMNNPDENAGMFLTVFLSFFCVVMFVAIVMSVASSAYTISTAICTYKLFDVLAPEKAILYTVLSCVVPLARGICLTKCRDSQNGMPPLPEDGSYNPETYMDPLTYASPLTDSTVAYDYNEPQN